MRGGYWKVVVVQWWQLPLLINQIAGVAFLACRGGRDHRRRAAQFTDKFWQENPELMKNLALEKLSTPTKAKFIYLLMHLHCVLKTRHLIFLS